MITIFTRTRHNVLTDCTVLMLLNKTQLKDDNEAVEVSQRLRKIQLTLGIYQAYMESRGYL